MPGDVGFLDDDERAVLGSAVNRLIPPAAGHPGGRDLGVVDYIDGLLGAFGVDPPRIFAGGPFSGRHGGEDGFSSFTPLTRIEELAWRTRIEGSQGIAEREFNGPVLGWQQTYRRGIAALGTDFASLPPDSQDTRLEADDEFRALLYSHACEGAYGDPVYGGNRDGAGWAAVGFPGDVQPVGYTDAEVSQP